MTADEVYAKLIELNNIEIPSDTKNRGTEQIFEIVSQIRTAQDFCTQYLIDCKKKLSEAKKIHLARKREVNLYVYEALKERRYLDSIKTFPERKYVLELEASNKINLEGSEQSLNALNNLKESLDDTLSNLRTAKEELNMVLGIMRQEFKDANSGALWNNPNPNLNYSEHSSPELVATTEDILADLKFEESN